MWYLPTQSKLWDSEYKTWNREEKVNDFLGMFWTWHSYLFFVFSFFCYELRFILCWATKATLRSRVEDGIRTRSNEPIASFSFGRIFFLKLANEYHNVLKIVCLLINYLLFVYFAVKWYQIPPEKRIVFSYLRLKSRFISVVYIFSIGYISFSFLNNMVL